MGKHAEAAAELRQALGASPTGRCCYYAELFLGAAEEALGNRDAARVAYEQAAELYPDGAVAAAGAQPAGAARRRSPGRAAAIERLFALPADDRDENDDPWWRYYVAQARDADDAARAMRQPFRSERLQ